MCEPKRMNDSTLREEMKNGTADGVIYRSRVGGFSGLT